MYSKGCHLICLILVYCGLTSAKAMEQTVSLEQESQTQQVKASTQTVQFNALPEQCVTLRQGRDCFAEINISWQSDAKQSLCLYQEGVEQHLVCWHDHDSAFITLDFVSNKTLNYQLRNANNNKVIVETKVKVSWLHKSNARKRRWRLF